MNFIGKNRRKDVNSMVDQQYTYIVDLLNLEGSLYYSFTEIKDNYVSIFTLISRAFSRKSIGIEILYIRPIFKKSRYLFLNFSEFCLLFFASLSL